MAGNARGWASEATKAAAAAAYREPVWAAEEAEGMAEAMPAGPPSATERVVGSLVTAVGTVASAAGLALGVSYQYYSVDQLESMADARFGPRVDALPDLDENGAPPPPSSADQQLQQQQQQQQRREVGFAETAARKFIDTRRWMDHQINYYIEPSAEKLLPDLPEAYRAHARTLVLDLDDTLVHSDWTRARGWRVFKRPGVDEFLDRMSQFYELVVYTHQNHTYVEPIMDRLDPQRRVTYRLARDATKYAHGSQVRDLSRMNRDPSKLLYLTCDPKTALLHPENTIVIPAFNVDTSEADTALLDIMPFLEMVIKTNAPDVRKVVASYEGKDVITEFRRRAKELRERQIAQQGSGGGRRGGLVGGLRGLSSAGR